MVFYRKYRPQTISELDLTSVRERLTAVLKNVRRLEDPALSPTSRKRTPSQARSVPHAYLFAGPKGLGKTSAARILAKAINCQLKEKGSIEPCNTCQACTSITSGSNMDVLEIDAASNRGIEEIRELRERVKYSPSNLTKKVYIIDEVHMLTTEAFNALLKTLEEPPSHVVFVLCTTELERVPATINSRTFYVPFEKPTAEELKVSLERIAKGEKLNVEDAVYELIYKTSEGSFRDAAKIVEELSLHAEGRITREIFEKVYKRGAIDQKVTELLEALAQKDIKMCLTILQDLASVGADFRVVIEEIVERLRLLLLLKSGIEAGIEDVADLDIADVEKLAERFNNAYKNIKFSVVPSLPLELVVIDWCIVKEQNAKVKMENVIEEKTIEIQARTTSKVTVQPSVRQAKIYLGKKEDDQQFYRDLLDAVKHTNHSIAGFLRGCKLITISATELELATSYKFHRDKLMEAKVKKVIEASASEILGRNMQVMIHLTKNA